jgi:hypothetical protein
MEERVITDEMLTPVEKINELRIGDEICLRTVKFPVFVVALFADAGTLGFDPAIGTGTIYGDFADNPGDVLEFDLSKDDVCKINR